jgi:hypothetical protein
LSRRSVPKEQSKIAGKRFGKIESRRDGRNETPFSVVPTGLDDDNKCQTPAFKRRAIFRMSLRDTAFRSSKQYDAPPCQRAIVFSLAAQSGIFYSGFTAVTEPVKAPDESRLACARRGAAVSDRIDLTQIEPAEKL